MKTKKGFMLIQERKKKEVFMEVRIQAIHFDATERLQDFIQKKTAKLEKYCDDINKVEVSLKVVKPETAMNKEASMKVLVPNGEFFAEELKKIAKISGEESENLAMAIAVYMLGFSSYYGFSGLVNNKTSVDENFLKRIYAFAKEIKY